MNSPFHAEDNEVKGGQNTTSEGTSLDRIDRDPPEVSLSRSYLGHKKMKVAGTLLLLIGGFILILRSP